MAPRLHALLVEPAPGGLSTEMTVNKALSVLEQVEIADQVVRPRVVIATELVEDVARLEGQMKASKKRIRVAVAASGTTLCDTARLRRLRVAYFNVHTAAPGIEICG